MSCKADKIALMSKIEVFVAYGYEWAENYYGFRSRDDDSSQKDVHRATVEELNIILSSNLTPSTEWQEIKFNHSDEGCEILGFQIR